MQLLTAQFHNGQFSTVSEMTLLVTSSQGTEHIMEQLTTECSKEYDNSDVTTRTKPNWRPSKRIEVQTIGLSFQVIGSNHPEVAVCLINSDSER